MVLSFYLFLLSFLLSGPSYFILKNNEKKLFLPFCLAHFVQQSIITSDRLQIYSAVVHSWRDPSLVSQESSCSTLRTNHTHTHTHTFFFLTSWILAGLFLLCLSFCLVSQKPSCIFFSPPVRNGPAHQSSSPFEEHLTAPMSLKPIILRNFPATFLFSKTPAHHPNSSLSSDPLRRSMAPIKHQ